MVWAGARKSQSDNSKNPIPSVCGKESAASEIVKCRKGGGTLILNPAVFSQHSEYLYLNSGWGVRLFSIKTGECVKVLETSSSGLGRVILVGVVDRLPVVVTADLDRILLLRWDDKTSAIKSNKVIKLPEDGTRLKAVSALLAPGYKDKSRQDLCLVLEVLPYLYTILFYNLTTAKTVVEHPLNKTRVGYGMSKQWLSFGGGENVPLMATRDEQCSITVYTVDRSRRTFRLKSGRDTEWTSVCCHPTETCVAGGDSIGRCILFRNILGSGNMVRTVYHWHTLPCQTISFTPAGTTMYTGGGEHVLVKWNLDNPNVKNFLPRLSSPIVHISVSPDNGLVAVSTLDNGVAVVESSHRLKTTVQQMCWGVISHPGAQLFSAGLQFSRTLQSVVLNSRPGHIQFYCPQTESSTTVDVCRLNYLTQERYKVIINSDVTLISLSWDGVWMATVEMRNEVDTWLELRLKLWNYVTSSRSWTLNSVVDMPHAGPVKSLKFRPSVTLEGKEDYLIVSTGDDRKFRLWSPTPIDSIYKTGVVWRCEGCSSYKDHDVGPACFSEDGSLLAVAFEHILTLWSADSLTYKISLSRFLHDIKHVEFGNGCCSHLVVTATECDVSVWNILTACVQWTAAVSPSLLISDPFSPYMALISTCNNLYIFNPLYSEREHLERDLCEDGVRILGATFALRENINKSAPPWLQKSYLYYIDSNQELLRLDVEDDTTSTGAGLRLKEDDDRTTLFADMSNAKTKSLISQEGATYRPRLHQYGVIGATAISEFLKVPSHTMASVSTLCSSLLQALALSKKPVREKERDERMEVEDEGDTDQLSSSSDSETHKESAVGHLPSTISDKDEIFCIDVDQQIDNIIDR